MATPSDPNELYDGKVVFERFALKRKLGQGGMGEVWLAQDTLLEQPVALKFLPGALLVDSVAYDLFRKEAQKALALTHPHIVRVYDFQRSAKLASISMEYVEGDTLGSRMQDRPDGILEPGEIHQWVEQLCAALDYAHNKVGIAHRDLKPSNLMIDRRGDLKVTDFGIAAPIARFAGRMNHPLRSSGTLVYMSPQQMQGMAPQPSDDIYAFGATLYELLTGFPPFFTGDIPAQVMSRVPPSIVVRREELGLKQRPIAPVWETIIRECLAKEPKDRPAKMSEIAHRLSYAHNNARAAAVGAAAAPKAPVAPPTSAEAKAPAKPGRFPLGIVLAVGAAVALAVGFIITRGNGPIQSAAVAPVLAPLAATAAPIQPPPTSNPSAMPVVAPAPAPALPAKPPAPAVIPSVLLSVAADVVFATEAEGLVLVDRAASELCLWRAARPEDVVRVSLRGSPVCEAYSTELKKVFLGYADGSLTVVNLAAADKAVPTEVRIAQHPAAPVALLCAGGLLVVQEDKDHTWAAHQLYATDGRKFAKRDMVYGSRSWVWSNRQRRLYFLSSTVSPNDINYEDISSNGTFGKTGNSPYHDSQGMVGRVQLMDRDSSIVLGSGRVFKASSLELEMTLPVPVFALGAMEKKTYILAETRAKSGSLYINYEEPMTEAVVHRLSAGYDIEATVKLPGTPVGLGVWPGGLVVVARQKKSTRLYWCDPDLVPQSLESKPAN